MNKKSVLLIILIVLLIFGGWKLSHNSSARSSIESTQKLPGAVKATIGNFDKTKYSVTDPASLWVVVNKQHPLNPLNYAPSDLRYPNVTLRVPGQDEMKMRDAAANALEQFFAGAAQAGYKLQVSTAYRGYAYQKSLYNGYVAAGSQAEADQKSARPGYSEHQTGWAVDIRTQSDKCSLDSCFGDLPEGQWLAANSYKYGFILRYPADKVAVTGYEYEPWHFRYVGTVLSQEMHKQHIETLEEFFNISGGSTYK